MNKTIKRKTKANWLEARAMTNLQIASLMNVERRDRKLKKENHIGLQKSQRCLSPIAKLEKVFSVTSRIQYKIPTHV